jgi:hypothetical protein
MTAHRDFPNEMRTVGKLLVDYSSIEISLMHCVAMVRDDFNTTLKALYCIRGETARINVAEALAKQKYADLGLAAEFDEGVAAMRHCLKIRNRFSHAHWHNPLDGLCYVSLEDLADSNEIVTDLTNLDFFYLDETLLNRQAAYFDHTIQCLAFVNYEGRKKVRKLEHNPVQRPTQLERPPLYTRKRAHGSE